GSWLKTNLREAGFWRPTVSAPSARLFFFQQSALGRGKLVQPRLADLRVTQIKRIQRLEDRGGDYDATEPFVVGRHDVPRSVFRGSLANHFLVRFHVVVPERAFLDIVGRELPVLLRVLKPLEETLPLFLVRHV